MAGHKISKSEAEAIRQSIEVIQNKLQLGNTTISTGKELADKDKKHDDVTQDAICASEVIAILGYANALGKLEKKSGFGWMGKLNYVDMGINATVIAHDYHKTGVIDTGNIWNIVGSALTVIGSATLTGALTGAPVGGVGAAPGAVIGAVAGTALVAGGIAAAVYGTWAGEKVDIDAMLTETKKQVSDFFQKESKEFKEAFNKGWDKVNEAFKNAESNFETLKENVSDFIKDKADKLADAHEEFTDKVGELFNDLSDALDDAKDDFADKVGDLFKDFADWIYDETDWNGDIPGFDDLLGPVFDWVHDKTGWNGDLPDFGDWFGLNRDGKYYIYDPIVLDLDGDGIETIGANDFNGAMFDHDNDGIRTATGWVKSDDGFLVVDRNGDGIINDGSELFGDGTLLSNGKFAKNGYEALAEFDSNDDGIIDDKDINFNQLKVWRDLNQDGKTDQNEIFSLDQLGIKSLSLNYTNANKTYDNGNILAELGSYETVDGKKREMGDVNFRFDSVYSEFIDPIKLTSEQKASINLKGIGRVRD